MSIIQQNSINVNTKANVFSHGEMKGALTWVVNASGSSCPPSGESTLAFILPGGLPRDTSRGGFPKKPNVSDFEGDHCEGKTLDVQGSNSALAGLDGLDSTNYDNVDITGVCKDFDKYIEDIKGSQKLFAHVKNKGQGLEALVVIDRVSGSRYFPEGRAKIRRKIQKRIKKRKEKGIFVVFTVDTKRYSMIEAWDNIWENFKLWKDAINVYRKRHMNAKESLYCASVLEQHKSGYPHLNVFFPGLRTLIKQKDFHKITEWWRMGGPNGVEVERERKPESVCNYILKYISKMKGWTKECLAILWHFRIRIWNISHSFYNEKKPSGWVLVAIYKSTSLEYLAGFFGITVDQDTRFVLVNSP